MYGGKSSVWITGVDPGCAMLELAADAGVPAEAVYLGAGLLRRVVHAEAHLLGDIGLIETPSPKFLRGRVDPSNLALTKVMLVYATCVCLANKAYGHLETPRQRLCLRRWAHELTDHVVAPDLLLEIEAGCLAALDWRL